MRIGEPARKHGVADADIWHAVRNALRRILMERHTDKEIEQAAQRFARLADALDPATAEVERTDDLREIAAAAEAVRADDARLREAVVLSLIHISEPTRLG